MAKCRRPASSTTSKIAWPVSRSTPTVGGAPPAWQAEIDMFPDYYEGYMGKYSATVAPLRRIKCIGPISYAGQAALQTDIDNLKAALVGHEVTEVFMPSTTPLSIRP